MKDGNRICGRENDLVGFLYGELDAGEAATFQSHLRECVACSDELASFGEIRESVAFWRNESLGRAGFPAAAAADRTTRGTAQLKPSARAALREFFNLSPLWMKGAAAFASLLLCLLLGLAAWSSVNQRFASQAPPVVVTNVGYTEQQVDAMVRDGVQKELDRLKQAQETAPASATLANFPKRTTGRRIGLREKLIANSSTPSARRPLSKAEREQLAADLRLIAAQNDNYLDLLDDRINQ